MSVYRFYPYRKDNPRELAQYVSPEIPPQLLVSGALDLLQQSSPRDVLAAIYDRIGQQHVGYSLHPLHTGDATTQLVRAPSTILSLKQATSLDLALLVASCCLAHDLVPLVLLFHPTPDLPAHALVAVATKATAHDGRRPKERVFTRGRLDDLDTLRELAADGDYLLLEVTGVAASANLRTDVPEGQGRDVDRRMRFGAALNAGRAHLHGPRPFAAALDILGLHALGYTPREPDPLPVAQLLLDALPTDLIPPHAPLPPMSRVGYSPAPSFVSREDDLLWIAQTIKSEQTAGIDQVASTGRIAAVNGLGGIGKTALAVEFCHRYGQFFAGGVFFLTFSEPEAVSAEIAACGGSGHLGLFTDPSGLKLDEQVNLVLRAWREPLPRLLVFDNCEDEWLLKTWKDRVSGGGCRVLVTSRRGVWSKILGISARALGVLSRGESVALLALHRPDLVDDPQLDDIAAELGDLPLALHLAGSYLETFANDARLGSPHHFLAALRSAPVLAHRALQGVASTPSPTNHELHLGRTFALSYDQLDPTASVDAMAIRLLKRAAYFAPGVAIPRDLLVATVLPDGSDDAAVESAVLGLHNLVALGLIDRNIDSSAFTLHRLLALFTHQTVADGAALADVEGMMNRVASEGNQTRLPSALLPYRAHLTHLAVGAMQRDDEHAATLLYNVGYHYREAAEYAQAQPLLTRALAIRERVLGPDHPDTARSLNTLAGLYEAQGDYAQAQSLAARALTIRERVLGPDHPDTARSLNTLAILYLLQGDYAQAQMFVERALAIRERVLGPDHPDTAQTLNTLAGLYEAQGAYAQAQMFVERALAIRERVLGPDHPDTARSFNTLARLYEAQGAYAQAQMFVERALAIRERVLGPDHPDTAQTLNTLAGLYEAQGAYAQAQMFVERALAIRERVLGPDHPDTARSFNTLARLYEAQGAYAQAQMFVERALAIRERVLGPDHPDTAQTLNTLAGLYEAQGAYAQAQMFVERALAIRERVLGPDHPDTAQTLNTLAGLYEAQGAYAQAQSLAERALAIRERVLGPDHPDTARSLNTLASLYQSQGAYAQAQSLAERALAIRERVLGPDHPDTAQTLNTLAGLYEAQGAYAQAQPLAERVLAIRERVLGPDHPDTAQTLNTLGELLRSQGDVAGAAPLYERALAIQEQVLGPAHPATLETRTRLARLETGQNKAVIEQPDQKAASWFVHWEETTARTLRIGESSTFTLRFSRTHGQLLRVPLNTQAITVFIDSQSGLQLESERHITIKSDGGMLLSDTISIRVTAILPGEHTLASVIYPGRYIEDKLPVSVSRQIHVARPVAHDHIPEILDRRVIPAPRPDLQIYVALEINNRGEEQLRVYVTCLLLNIQMEKYVLRLSRAEVAALRYAAAHHATLARQSLGDNNLALLHFGMELYDILMPSAGSGAFSLRKVFERLTILTRTNRRSLTVLVIADEPVALPWDLIVPYQDVGQEDGKVISKESDFIGADFSLSYWFGRQQLLLLSEMPLRRTQLAHYNQAVAELPGWEQALGGDRHVVVSKQSGELLVTDPNTDVVGLHLVRYTDDQDYSTIALPAGDQKDSQVLVNEDQRLDFSARHPLVTLSFVDDRVSEASCMPSEYTHLEERWILPLLRAEASALVGPRWTTPPEIDKLFYRNFFTAVRQGRTLGEAVRVARHSVRMRYPNGGDWLAYAAFGHPACEPYQVMRAQVYTAFEIIGHPDKQPLQPGQMYTFRATYTGLAPDSYTGRVHLEQPLPALVEAQVAVDAPHLNEPIFAPLRQIAPSTFEAHISLTMPEKGVIAPFTVYFLDGEQELSSKILNFQLVGGKQ